MNVRNGIENLAQILPAQTAQQVPPPKTDNPAQSNSLAVDKAQVSSVATQVAQSAAASDVRLDKVANIQSALQAGTYQVPASDVAKSVIASLLTSGK
jgi:flagellar biosynthesis anti-sigma factor FlgM